MRKCFSSILAAVSIRSKPNYRFQPFCSSSISKRRICPSMCIAVSALTRTVSRKRQLVASTSAIIFVVSRSSTVVMTFQIKNVVLAFYLTSGPRRLTATSCSPGSFGFPGNCGSRDAPSFDRCLFCTGALLCCALDRWRRGGVCYSTPLKPPPNSCPAAFQTGVVSSRSASRG